MQEIHAQMKTVFPDFDPDTLFADHNSTEQVVALESRIIVSV